MYKDKLQQKQYQKDRYDWYKSRGICTVCGVSWAEPGHVYCKSCAEKNERCHARKREERIEAKRRRRADRIAAGLCTECGARPATEGMRMCPRCRAMRNDSTRKYKIGKKLDRIAEKARNRA